MLSRLILPALALFWATMNVLLWRAEFKEGSPGGNVPPEAIWRKILTAPDSSTLIISQHGRRIGICHWATGVSEAATGVESSTSQHPADPSDLYRIEMDASWTVARTNRARLKGSLQMRNGTDWEELNLRLDLRGTIWELQASPPKNRIHFKVEGEDLQFDRTLNFSELQNPGALLREIAGAQLNDSTDASPLLTGARNIPKLETLVKWKAHKEVLNIHHAPLRVFRLETDFLDRSKITVVINTAGDLLKIELPGEIILLQESLDSL